MASRSAAGGEAAAQPGSRLSWLDWIWHIRGEVPLLPGQTPDETFARLAPLFAHAGTTHARIGDVMMVTKRDQLAQDPLSIVDSGTLRIESAEQGAVLRYHLVSRALLYCFLAPLLFLALGQITIALGKFEKPEPPKKAAAERAEVQRNPIDVLLGAPAPRTAQEQALVDAQMEKDKFSPTASYVFTGIFAALWLLGRLLEPWLIKRLFKRSLAS